METTKSELARTLMVDEGFRTKPYICTAGKMTIGVGRNFEDNPFTPDERAVLGIKSTIPGTQFQELSMKPLKEEEVRWLLQEDLTKLLESLSSHPVLGPIFAKQDMVRQVAMGNLVYNLGIRGLLKFQKFLAAMDAKDYVAAEASLAASRWSKQVKSRSKRVRDMVLTGKITGY